MAELDVTQMRIDVDNILDGTTSVPKATEATKLAYAPKLRANLESSNKAEFNGEQDVTFGVEGKLSVEHGGTGSTTLPELQYKMFNGTQVDNAAVDDYTPILRESSDPSSANGYTSKIRAFELFDYIADKIKGVLGFQDNVLSVENGGTGVSEGPIPVSLGGTGHTDLASLNSTLRAWTKICEITKKDTSFIFAGENNLGNFDEVLVVGTQNVTSNNKYFSTVLIPSFLLPDGTENRLEVYLGGGYASSGSSTRRMYFEISKGKFLSGALYMNASEASNPKWIVYAR